MLPTGHLLYSLETLNNESGTSLSLNGHKKRGEGDVRQIFVDIKFNATPNLLLATKRGENYVVNMAENVKNTIMYE